MNLDRFSRPLTIERVVPSLMSDWIQEQQELNKCDLVDSYISNHWESFGLVPDVEEIQEHFYKMDLDQDLIIKRLEMF